MLAKTFGTNTEAKTMQNDKTNPNGRNDTMNTPDTIAEHRIDVDSHPGGTIESYGAGVAHTPYDAVYIGRGRSEQEAAEDALEMLAQDLPRIEGRAVDTWGMDRIAEMVGGLSDDETAAQEMEAECYAAFLEDEELADTDENQQAFYDSLDETFELSAALYVRFGYPEDRESALARFLDTDPNSVERGRFDTYGLDTFDADGGTYAVGTDSEADKAAAENIKESLWAFNSEFLAGYVPGGVGADTLRILQEAKCEDSNGAITAMVGDRLDSLVSDAIDADGRGHFLSGYDGEENETDGPDGETLYIYRTN